MATTTNFGWETPDDTDLVKDGAAAIRTALNGVDTSFVDLKGGTSGQILSKASNTDLDYTWIDQNTGDITGVTAGTGISGGGTSGTVTVTNSMATAIDAKGDLIGGTGADAFARLAVGTNGQVLTADSAETTGLKWATPAGGGKTLLSTTTLSGSSTSISVSASTYTDLFILVRNVYTSATCEVRLRLNSDTGSNYNQNRIGAENTSLFASNSQLATSFYATAGNTFTTLRQKSNCEMTVYQLNDGADNLVTWTANGDDGVGYTIAQGIGTYDASAAITNVTLFTSTGTFSGGTVYIYGVK